MRRPPLCCEAHENGGHDVAAAGRTDPHHGMRGPDCCSLDQKAIKNKNSPGPMSRVRRFLHLSLHDSTNLPSASCRSETPPMLHHNHQQHHHHTHQHHPQNHQYQQPEQSEVSNSKSQLVAFRIEAESVIGRPLDDVMSEGMGGRGRGKGVPALVHALCDHMLDYGIDYETLLSDRWYPEEVRLAFVGVRFDHKGEELDLDALKACSQFQMTNCSVENSVTAALLRLFLEDLPQPLLGRQAAKDLKNVFRDYDQRVGVYDRARHVLQRRLSEHNLQLLSYLAQFLDRAGRQQLSDCSSQPKCLSRLLARIISSEGAGPIDYTTPTRDEAESDYAHSVAEILINNHDLIFTDLENEEEAGFSSCSSAPSSPGRQSPARPDGAGDEPEPEDESTSTTTDTDEFRSPPVSPTKGALKTHDIGRATAELPDTDGYRTKKSNFGKTYLPSITDLLSSPDESCLKDEVQRSTRHDFKDRYDKQCTSDGSSSEVDEAPSSPCPAVPLTSASPCPHEERRSTERFSFRRGGGGGGAGGGSSSSAALVEQSSAGKKVKKTRKRKHSKDRGQRGGGQPSSGEDEEASSERGGESFIGLLGDGGDDPPQPFDPSPACDPVNLTTVTLSDLGSGAEVLAEGLKQETSTEGRWAVDLFSSNEPVTSDRRWGLGGEVSMQDNWRRTTPHYSREDDEVPNSPQYYNLNKKTDSPDTVKSPQAAIKLLQKNVNSIKKKIKKFEEEFESAFGYRPSHSEKMKHKDVKKYMSELSKSRKELKLVKEDVSNMMSSHAVTAFPMSFLRSQEPTSPVQSPATPGGAKDTLIQVLEHLQDKRRDSERPEDLIEMNLEQLNTEKTSLQRALLYYESMHGRPSTKEERDLARPLYDRYRTVKRTIVRSASRTKEMIELAPILEHEAMDFTLASPRHRGSLEEEEEDSPLHTPLNADTLNAYPNSPKSDGYSEDDDDLQTPEPCSSGLPSPRTPVIPGLHALPLHELKDRKRLAKEEKKKIRRVLREFEEAFESQNGRKLQKDDRGPMCGTYADYKQVKAKLRLLEALLSKHDALKMM